MPHKLDARNRGWKDAVDGGLVIQIDEASIVSVDFTFWHRSNAYEPVSCNTAASSGREVTLSLRTTAELSKTARGKYECVVTMQRCAPEEDAPVRKGTHADPPVTINLIGLSPRTLARHSAPLRPTR